MCLERKKFKNSTAVNHDHQGEVVYFWIVCFSSDKMIMAEKQHVFQIFRDCHDVKY